VRYQSAGVPVPTEANGPMDLFTPDGEPPAPPRPRDAPPRDFRPLRVPPRIPALPGPIPAQADAPPTEKLSIAAIVARSAARVAALERLATPVTEPPTTEKPTAEKPADAKPTTTAAEAAGEVAAEAPPAVEVGTHPRHALAAGRGPDRARLAASVLVLVTLAHAIAVAWLLGHPAAANALRELLDHLIG
jgi:hypothetical protein